MKEIKTLRLLASAHRTNVSDVIINLIDTNNYDGLLNYSITASDYSESQLIDFRHDYLVTSFLKRTVIPCLSDVDSMHQKCVDDFFINEQLCRKNNIRFQTLPRDVTRISEVAQIMDDILGNVSFDEVLSNCRFGPGSSLNEPISGRVPSDKFTDLPTLTPSLVRFIRPLVGIKWYRSIVSNCLHNIRSPISEDQCYEYVNSKLLDSVVCYNSFTTVPKSSFKRRPICIEPKLNGWLQLGIGAAIRSRLNKTDNDLQKGQDRNRDMAQRAYTDKLATIDLSAASDTISHDIVMNVMSRSKRLRRWFHLLSIARVTHTRIISDNKPLIIQLSKLGSMGNGYIFEFESLMFLSIVRACVPKTEWHNVSVYGDDIICPQLYAADVMNLLSIYGFTINSEKSFISGAFFESCGHDYFYGNFVRPIFAGNASEISSNDIPWELRIANRLRVYSNRISTFPELYTASVYRRVWNWLKGQIPLQRIHRGSINLVPEEAGDTGLISSYSELINDGLPNDDKSSTWEGYAYVSISKRSITRRTNSNSYLLLCLSKIQRSNHCDPTLGSPMFKSYPDLNIEDRDPEYGEEPVLRSNFFLRRFVVVSQNKSENLRWGLVF